MFLLLKRLFYGVSLDENSDLICYRSNVTVNNGLTFVSTSATSQNHARNLASIQALRHLCAVENRFSNRFLQPKHNDQFPMDFADEIQRYIHERIVHMMNINIITIFMVSDWFEMLFSTMQKKSIWITSQMYWLVLSKLNEMTSVQPKWLYFQREPKILMPMLSTQNMPIYLTHTLKWLHDDALCTTSMNRFICSHNQVFNCLNWLMRQKICSQINTDFFSQFRQISSVDFWSITTRLSNQAEGKYSISFIHQQRAVWRCDHIWNQWSSSTTPRSVSMNWLNWFYIFFKA